MTPLPPASLSGPTSSGSCTGSTSLGDSHSKGQRSNWLFPQAHAALGYPSVTRHQATLLDSGALLSAITHHFFLDAGLVIQDDWGVYSGRKLSLSRVLELVRTWRPTWYPKKAHTGSSKNCQAPICQQLRPRLLPTQLFAAFQQGRPLPARSYHCRGADLPVP